MTVQLIGGEMLQWSDLSGTHGPLPAGGPALLPLPAGTGGRTLVAGPHDPALIDAVPADQVTVLVRGVADAEALAARYSARPGVAVCCGSLEKLAAAPAYDTVIALDGLGRLCTPEAPDLSWDEMLGQLLAVLRPGGRLLLGVENPFGLHRLLALPPAPADTDWVAPDGPSGPADLHSRLAAAGVPVVREYAAYPTPGTPAALLGAEVLADPGLRGYLAATLAGARPAPQLLADPDRLVTGALRHGLAASLAPAWILLAGDIAAGPAALTANGELRLDGGAWVRGDGTPIPIGRTLEDLVLDACGRRAMPVVRELLTAWQDGPAAGVPAGQVVVDAAGACHGLTAPASPASPAPPVEALRRLAATLIGGGYAHLWPSPADEAELTALLAGMAGRELDPHSVPAGDPAGARPGAGSVRELMVARDRLEQELADARAKHEFYERTIASRDAELKRVRQMNALLSATVPGKAATTLVGGLKAGRRAMRSVVKRPRD
ncbi:hypothetical protein [Paractinoplanes globisporus]|uniref:Methyltransferase n=1 Tax=Paractinoplanes globisporus TaxID=113565 RepID=A0ABW6WVP1_9ACTN|nr:hypothetical protein [Actinoplanes globisporus]